jgi:hypothetical protein
MTADEPGYGLVMPFVTVASKGGPHDDAAYCAGYEMGRLDAILQTGRQRGIGLLSTTCRTENQAQADLIAMHRGYTATFTESDVEGWTHAEFEPIQGDS